MLLNAERLFATKGIGATSLREIATAAGTSNNNAVQYHFGSKAALLNAIYFHRIACLEPIRSEMLARAEERGVAAAPAVLLQILCLPHVSLAAEDGSHPYAGFLVQYVTRHWHESLAEVAPETQRVAPTLHDLVARLAAKVEGTSDTLARARVMLCNLMFLNALLRWDNIGRHASDLSLKAVLDDALTAARAALCAPSNEDATAPDLFADLFPGLLSQPAASLTHCEAVGAPEPRVTTN